MDIGLVAAVVGSAAAVLALGVGAWQVWIMLHSQRAGDGRNGNAEHPQPTGGGSAPPEKWADKGIEVPVQVDLLPDNVRGRNDLLGELKKQYRDGGLVVLTGAGGMGKSTIARELVRRMLMRSRAQDGLFRWEVPGWPTERRFIDGLTTVARDLGATEADLEAISSLQQNGPERLWKLLEQGPKGWLLIIDNADKPEFLAGPGASGTEIRRLTEGKGWARSSNRGLTIVTSRESGKDREEGLWPARAIIRTIERLSDSDAAEILLDEAPNAGNELQARVLAQRLGGLPLILHLVGRYLKSDFVVEYPTFDAYRQALEKDPRVIRLLNRGPELRLLDSDPEKLEDFKRVMVMFTWELSLDALANRRLPQARPLLRLLSCYAAAIPIPVSLLKADLLDRLVQSPIDEASSPSAGSVPVDEILEGLGALGLISPVSQGNEKALFVHPVIADTNRIYLRERGSSDPSPILVLQTAVDLLASVLDDLAEDRPQDWPTFRALTPHLQALITNSVAGPDEGDARRLGEDYLDSLVRLAGHTAMAYRKMWLPEAGVELVTSALVHFGGDRDTPAVLLARQQQADLLIQTGQAAEAEHIYDKVLQAQLRIWPVDDLTNLIVRFNRAWSIGVQRRWKEAEAALLSILDDERRLLGNDSSYTLSTRRGLIALACRQGAWAKAEGALRALWEDEKQVLGENSPSSLGTRFNLAQAIRHQDRHYEAEGIIRKLLQDARELWGNDHPNTVTIQEFSEGTLLLPVLFSTPDKHEEFGKILFDATFPVGQQTDSQERAVMAYQEFLGRFANDPTPTIRILVAKALLNKGVALGRLRRTQDEEASYQDLIDRFADDPALALRELVAKALHYKAITLTEMNRPQEALPAIEQAVALYQQLIGTTPAVPQTGLDSASKLLTQIKTEIARAQGPQAE